MHYKCIQNPTCLSVAHLDCDNADQLVCCVSSGRQYGLSNHND